MDIYKHLEEFQQEIITPLNLAELDEKYYQLSKLENPQAANEIRRVDFSEYKSLIKTGFQRAIKLSQANLYKGIYFEYDIDNDWQTNCFLCPIYNTIEQNDEDWACDFDEDFNIGEFSELKEMYKNYYHHETRFDSYINLYLIVRTVVAFKEAIGNELNNTQAAVCVAFHDQSVITRLKRD